MRNTWVSYPAIPLSPTSRVPQGSTHILLGIFLGPSGLPIVAELGRAMQDTWGFLPKVSDQINLLPGLIPRDDCRERGKQSG